MLAACGTDTDTDTDLTANSTGPAAEAAQPENTPQASTPTNADEYVALIFEEANAPEDPGDIPDDPWGKDLPTGPAPTAPPAPPSDFNADGMYTIEEYEETIRYRYPEYDWPPSYQLDLDKSLERMGFPKGSRIEAPGEYTFLGLYHECAWEIALLDAVPANDQESIDQSLYQLVEISQKKNPLSYDENRKALKRDMWDRVALRDVAPLQQWVDNNCERMRPYFVDTDSAIPPSSRLTDNGHFVATAASIS